MSATPGPWKEGPFQVYVGNIIDRDETFTEIADCYLETMRQPKMSGKEREANIRLIAAAPRMLDLVKARLTQLEDTTAHGAQLGTLNQQWFDDARALLRKIEGEEATP